MSDQDTIRELVSQYDEYVRRVLRPSRARLKQMFRRWKDPTHWARHARLTRLPAPSPVQRAVSRIKRPESVIDKLLRKPSAFPDGLSMKSIEQLGDALGGRVVVYFLANLPLVDREIRDSDVVELSGQDPPTAYLSHDLAVRLGLSDCRVAHKDSGYASIHYTVRFRTSSLAVAERPWFEIQVRTLAEDVWGEIEHVLGYKPNKRTSFAVRRQFRIIASELTAIDEHFNLLYEELTRFQEEGIFRDTDPLNAENFPPVLSELGIGCAQAEIDGQLKLLASRGISTVGELSDAAAGNRLGLIRNAYRSYRSRLPTDFEVVSSLAATKGVIDDRRVVEIVKTQIDILEAWDGLKQEFKKEDAN